MLRRITIALITLITLALVWLGPQGLFTRPFLVEREVGPLAFAYVETGAPAEAAHQLADSLHRLLRVSFGDSSGQPAVFFPQGLPSGGEQPSELRAGVLWGAPAIRRIVLERGPSLPPTFPATPDSGQPSPGQQATVTPTPTQLADRLPEALMLERYEAQPARVIRFPLRGMLSRPLALWKVGPGLEGGRGASPPLFESLHRDSSLILYLAPRDSFTLLSR